MDTQTYTHTDGYTDIHTYRWIYIYTYTHTDGYTVIHTYRWIHRHTHIQMDIHTCTMLLEQIKGFYHGITKIFLLVGSYTMLSWHF